MMMFLRRFRRASGENFFSEDGTESTEVPVEEGMGAAFSFAILFSRKVLLHALNSSTQGANE
jgi:hypothetical protein